jgi:chemotaxis protein MotA
VIIPIGFVIILVCVFGTFMLAGGKMDIIIHALPLEMAVIGGASIGSFIIANQMRTVKQAGAGLKRAFKGPRWAGPQYEELLALLFALLDTFRKKGATGIEPHLDAPGESQLFQRYPAILGDHHLTEFICDYLRMMTVSFDDPHQLSEAMENDIDRHHAEEHAPQHALQVMADGLPAIGIVAAVLGVIKTMASIDQPVEVLGAMIGGALVGTFLGVLLSYCIVGPLAAKLHQVIADDSQPYAVVKTAIVAYAQNVPVQVAVELARRLTPSAFAPSFQQFEARMSEVKNELAALPA